MKNLSFKVFVSPVWSLILLTAARGTHAQAEVQPPSSYEEFMPSQSKELGGTLPMIWRLNDKEIPLRFSTDPATQSNIDECPAWALYHVKGAGQITLSEDDYRVKSVCFLFAIDSFWRYRIELQHDRQSDSTWIDCFSDFCWQ